MTGGVAVFDYNGDGRSGHLLPERPAAARHHAGRVLPPHNALYRNRGRLEIHRCHGGTGVDGGGFGMGVAVGDYDQDGFPDLFVNNFGPNVLYRNNGDGTFTRRNAGSRAWRVPGRSAPGPTSWTSTATATSICSCRNYVQFSFEKNPKVTVMGFAAYAGPYLFEKQPNTLYRNRRRWHVHGRERRIGDCRRIRRRAWERSAPTTTMTATPISSSPTTCRQTSCSRTTATGQFEEVGLRRGVAFDVNGQAHSNMGVDCRGLRSRWLAGLLLHLVRQRDAGPVSEHGRPVVHRRDGPVRRPCET